MNFMLVRLDSWFKYENEQIYKDSIFSRFIRLINIKSLNIFDDRVKDLQNKPLGMLFYNIRALFFSTTFLVLVIIYFTFFLFYNLNEIPFSLLYLSTFWILGVFITIIKHHHFLAEIKSFYLHPISEETSSEDLPQIFDNYFLLDFILVFSMILIGHFLGFKFIGFISLLISYLIIYSAFSGKRRGRFVFIFLFLCIALFLFIFLTPNKQNFQEPQWYSMSLYLIPSLGLFIIAIIFVRKISWLRAAEEELTNRQLKLLGQYEDTLTGIPMSDFSSDKVEKEVFFRSRVKEILKDLCTKGGQFWYVSACLWFVEKHQEFGELLLPGPNFNFLESKNYSTGINSKKGNLSTNDLMRQQHLFH